MKQLKKLKISDNGYHEKDIKIVRFRWIVFARVLRSISLLCRFNCRWRRKMENENHFQDFSLVFSIPFFFSYHIKFFIDSCEEEVTKEKHRQWNTEPTVIHSKQFDCR